ncbi:MAG: hypothetical protein JST69_09985 [Bacteroidetes bacterium]|nr:hypothetical protein [Bacteroidota bacterium]
MRKHEDENNKAAHQEGGRFIGGTKPHRKICDLTVEEFSFLIDSSTEASFNRLLKSTQQSNAEPEVGSSRPGVPKKYAVESPPLPPMVELELVNIVKKAMTSLLNIHGLSMDGILAACKNMIENAIAEIVPKHDPEEDIFYNATEAGKFLGVSRTTIQEWKGIIINGKAKLQFSELDRKISKAECRRARNRLSFRADSIAKRIDFPENDRKKKKK